MTNECCQSLCYCLKSILFSGDDTFWTRGNITFHTQKDNESGFFWKVIIWHVNVLYAQQSGHIPLIHGAQTRLLLPGTWFYWWKLFHDKEMRVLHIPLFSGVNFNRLNVMIPKRLYKYKNILLKSRYDTRLVVEHRDRFWSLQTKTQCGKGVVCMSQGFPG